MARTILAVILSCLAAAQAAAGAWPRGEGKVFVSVEGTVTAGRDTLFSAVCPTVPVSPPGAPPLPELDSRCPGYRDELGRAVTVDAITADPKTYGAIYFEYGLGETVTAGLDIGLDPDEGSWTALAFLRRSFSGDGPDVWAVELAAGPSRLWDDSTGTVVRPGLHWGRGTEWGWLGAESYVVLASQNDRPAYKLDLTAGWKRSDTVSWIAQVQTADYPGAEPTVRLAPSYVRRMTERMRVELGLLADVSGREDVGLSLSSWYEF